MKNKSENKKRLNCWEFNKCGREPGGDKIDEIGICPTTTEIRVDGIHGGKNGGRCCWVITGTFCKGDIQGTFAKKFGNCQKCDFYQKVLEESARDVTVKLTSTILGIIEREK